MRVLFWGFFIWIVTVLNLSAQEIIPKGRFVQDSMAVGEFVEYTMSLSYPSHLQVLFPDSTYSYYPFEFISKRYFPTKTDSLKSYDSVVYQLASFELDQVQKLALPVFLIRQGDSLEIESSVGSVYLQERITQMSDSLQLKTETTLVKLEQQFNYPYALIGLLVLMVVAVLIFVFFGKRIRNKWRIWRLKKRHEKFIESFRQQLTDMHDLDPAAIETLLFKWKKYAEKVSKQPFARLTTKEIYRLTSDDALHEQLQLVDRTIYSSRGKEDASKAFEFLLAYTETILSERIKEIEENGK